MEKMPLESRPDLARVVMPAEDMGLGVAVGNDALVEAIQEEIAALAAFPVLLVQREHA